MENTLVKIESPLVQTSLSATGWNLPTTMTEGDWKQAGSFLMQVNQARQWWLGDWWNACKWGDEKRKEICKEIGVEYPTAKNAGWVSRNFELSRRRDNLTFTHHHEVASISDPVIQDKLLDWCLTDSRRKSVRELREKVQEYQSKKDWEDFDAEILIDNGEAEFNRKIAELEAKLKEKEKGVEPNLNNLIPEILKRVKGGKIPESRGFTISTLPPEAQQTILFDIEQKETAQLTSENLQRERNKALKDALDAIKAKEAAIVKLEEMASGKTEAELMLKQEKELKRLREEYLTKLHEERKALAKEASETHSRLNKEKIEKAEKDKAKAERAKKEAQEKASAAYKKREELEREIKKLSEQLEVNNPTNIDIAMEKQIRSSANVFLFTMKEFRHDALSIGGGMERSIEAVEMFLNQVSQKLEQLKEDLGTTIIIDQ